MAKSESFQSIESRTRAVPPVHVFASIGPKKRLLTLSGMEGSIDVDLASLDQLQAVIDVARDWLVLG